MSATAPPIGSFIPLRGDELKKIVLAKFEAMLGDFPAWSAAIAHIRPRIKITLNIQTFPYDPGRNLELEVSLRKATHVADPPPENTEIPLVNKTIQTEETINDPNQAREQAKLPVPMKQETSDGQIVDMIGDEFSDFNRGQGGSESSDSGS